MITDGQWRRIKDVWFISISKVSDLISRVDHVVLANTLYLGIDSPRLFGRGFR